MDVNFDAAILAHSRWEKRLADLIEGESTEVLDPEKVGRDDQCDLGKWIQSVPPEVQKDSDFGKLVAEHSAFHHQAALITRLVQKGDLVSARDGIGLSSEYLRKSTAVINLIGTLRHRIR